VACFGLIITDSKIQSCSSGTLWRTLWHWGEVSVRACLFLPFIIPLELCVLLYHLQCQRDKLAGCDSHTGERSHLLGCYTMLLAEKWLAFWKTVVPLCVFQLLLSQDEGTILRWNICDYLPVDMANHLRRLEAVTCMIWHSKALCKKLIQPSKLFRLQSYFPNIWSTAVLRVILCVVIVFTWCVKGTGVAQSA
jgi:hypothetical protein